jgi:hypothetical protein
MQYEYQKTQNLMPNLNPLQKLQKTHAKKVISKKWLKNRVLKFLTFITVCNSFRPVTIFWNFFF